MIEIHALSCRVGLPIRKQFTLFRGLATQFATGGRQGVEELRKEWFTGKVRRLRLASENLVKIFTWTASSPRLPYMSGRYLEKATIQVSCMVSHYSIQVERRVTGILTNASGLRLRECDSGGRPVNFSISCQPISLKNTIEPSYHLTPVTFYS